jgi:hypothetical protein
MASVEFREYIEKCLQLACDANRFVYTGKSWIPEGGTGLFAREFIRKGDVVTCYVGKELPTKIAIKQQNKSYLMRLGEFVHLFVIFFVHLLVSFPNLPLSLWSRM